MKEKIYELLVDKVTDIFIEIQNELGIVSGDIEPLLHLAICDKEDELADLIAVAIENQRKE